MAQTRSEFIQTLRDSLKLYIRDNDCDPLFRLFGLEVPPPGESREIICRQIISDIIQKSTEATDKANHAAAQFQTELQQTKVRLEALQAQLETLPVQEVFVRGVDPVFNTSAERKGKNSRNTYWPDVPAELVEEMDDCTFEAIQEELGVFFQSQTSYSQWGIESKLADVANYLKPQYEAEIQHVVQAYIIPIVQSCIQAGLNVLPELLGVAEKDANLIVKGIEGMMDPVNITECTPEVVNKEYLRVKRRKGIADWSIYLLSENGQKRYVTVGETKMDSKWNSSWLPKRRGGIYANGEAEWPMRQQAKYCRAANTSWSFLYSPKEVVLSRFYLVDDKRLDSPMGVQWKSIPMYPDGHIGGWGPMMGIWSWIMFSYVDPNG